MNLWHIKIVVCSKRKKYIVVLGGKEVIVIFQHLTFRVFLLRIDRLKLAALLSHTYTLPF